MSVKKSAVVLAICLLPFALSPHARSEPFPPNPVFPPCPQPVGGLDAKALEQFEQTAGKAETSALIVVKDGCTALERHDQDYGEVFSVQSITKSVVSLAIGT